MKLCRTYLIGQKILIILVKNWNHFKVCSNWLQRFNQCYGIDQSRIAISLNVSNPLTKFIISAHMNHHHDNYLQEWSLGWSSYFSWSWWLGPLLLSSCDHLWDSHHDPPDDSHHQYHHNYLRDGHSGRHFNHHDGLQKVITIFKVIIIMNIFMTGWLWWSPEGSSISIRLVWKHFSPPPRSRAGATTPVHHHHYYHRHHHVIKVIVSMTMLEDEGADICMFLEYLQKYQFCKFPAETFPFSIVDNRERASNQLLAKMQENNIYQHGIVWHLCLKIIC